MDSTLFSTIALILSGLALAIGAFTFFKARRDIAALREVQKVFFRGKTGKDLEEVLLDIASHVEANRKRTTDLKQETGNIWETMRGCYSNIGIVRFNPFRDTGSNQSFVIALLNDHHNGFIITSLYSRQGTNIYAKPIERGVSEFTLTEEEKIAIKKATS